MKVKMILLCVMVCLLNVPAFSDETPSMKDLIDKYTQALDSTSSFIEHYEKTTDFSRRSAWGQDKRKKFVRGQLRHDDQRLYSQSYTWGDFDIKDKGLPEGKPSYHCYIENGRNKMIYQNSRDTSKPVGVVYRQPLSNLGVKKVVLSGHFGVSYMVGYVGSDERLDAILRQADRIRVRGKTEKINDSECFVIEADTKYGRYAIWLDPEHGFHAAKVRRSAKGGDYTHGRLLSKGETAKTYLDNLRFEKVDDIWVPMEADSGYDRRMPSGNFEKSDYHYKRTKIVLNPDHDKLGSFDDPLENPSNDPELINGTYVKLMNRDGEKKYIWRDGKLVPEKKEKTSKTEPVPSAGKAAPSFIAKTLTGKDIKLEDYRGKVVILYFWATWCRPCVAGTPKLKELYADRKTLFGDDFEMISLSMDNSDYPVREHVKKYGLTWPQVRIGLQSKISSDYGVNNSAPNYFLIGPDGKLLLTPESPQVDTKSFIKEVFKNRNT